MRLGAGLLSGGMAEVPEEFQPGPWGSEEERCWGSA